MKELIATLVLMTTTWNTISAQDYITPVPSTDREKPWNEFVWLDVRNGRIGGQAYINADLADGLVLIVVLHGDLLSPNYSYHYRFAQTVAAQASNVVVVGLLRPGYSDERGNRSDGNTLNRTGDNYTAEVVEAVASATKQFKARYGVGSTILIGHSGGAAIAALVLGRHPKVADAALLVACPCDLPAWRAHMMTVRASPIWQWPHQKLSPIDTVSGVQPTSIVELVVGDEDEFVLPEFSRDYVAALREHSVQANVTILPGLGHNIPQQSAVMVMANELIAAMQALN